MKKYSKDANELLSTFELIEIKAGGTDQLEQMQPVQNCGIICTTCLGCTSSCTVCTTKMMDVVPIP